MDMKIRLSELRRIIRETIEESDVNQSEFTYAIAKAAEKGQKSVDIDGEKFPVKMSKDKAKQITKKQSVREAKCNDEWHDVSPVRMDGNVVYNCPTCGESVPDKYTKE